MENKPPESNESLRYFLKDQDAELYEKIRETMQLWREKQTKEQEARRIYEGITAEAKREEEMRQRLQSENLERYIKTWGQATQPSFAPPANVPQQTSQQTQGQTDTSWVKETFAQFAAAAAQSQAQSQTPPVPSQAAPALRDPSMGHSAPPAAQTQPQTPAYKEAFFNGIWDIAFPNGARYELALIASSMNRKFSFANSAMDNTSWGRWTLEEVPGSFPMIFITREGYFPAKFYGILWTEDLPQPSDEVWTVTGVDGETAYFPGGVSMTRRTGNIAETAARIAYVQSESKRAEVTLMSNAKMAIGQRDAVMQVQRAMGIYIDRHRYY